MIVFFFLALLLPSSLSFSSLKNGKSQSFHIYDVNGKDSRVFEFETTRPFFSVAKSTPATVRLTVTTVQCFCGNFTTPVTCPKEADQVLLGASSHTPSGRVSTWKGLEQSLSGKLKIDAKHGAKTYVGVELCPSCNGVLPAGACGKGEALTATLTGSIEAEWSEKNQLWFMIVLAFAAAVLLLIVLLVGVCCAVLFLFSGASLCCGALKIHANITDHDDTPLIQKRDYSARRARYERDE